MFASEAVAVGLAIAGSGLGIISSSLDLKSGLEMLESVAELKKNARNVNDYKKAARLLAEAMVKISVNGIMLIVSLIQFGEACGKGFELYYRNKKVCVHKINKLEGNNDKHKEPLKDAPYIKDGKPNGRPTVNKKNKLQFEKDVYNSQVDKDGILRDPNNGKIIKWTPGQARKGIVDFGHKSGMSYQMMFENYKNGNISLEELKSFQTNYQNFQLEIPSSNRSHLFE